MGSVEYRHTENGGASLVPEIRRKQPARWDKALLRSAGLLPISQDWYDLCLETGIPMVAETHFSGRDLPMPDRIGGFQSGWWAPAWVFLALTSWGKRSQDGTRKWLRELMTCEKQRVVIVIEMLMIYSTKRSSWIEPARIWLDEQRTTSFVHLRMP